MVRLSDHSSANRLPIFLLCLLLLSVSIDQVDKADAQLLSRRRTYISLAFNASSHSPTTLRDMPSLFTTPSRSKNHPRVQPNLCVHWTYSTLHVTRHRASPGQATNSRAMLHRGGTELSHVRVENRWKQGIDVYGGGRLVCPTVDSTHRSSSAQHLRESSVQMQIASPSLSKRTKRTLICL